MSVVLLGGNRFVDCLSILAYRGSPMLQVDTEPLRVQLVTPENLPSHRAIRVDQQVQTPEKDVRVVATSESFSVFWRDHALALATRWDPETAHLKLDLRPLGINIYDDFAGLHIGTNIFSGNEVSHAAVAINLGD